MSVSETALARQLGVDRSTLKRIRLEFLTDGEDWSMHRSAFEYTDAGVSKIRAALEGESSSENSASSSDVLSAGKVPPAALQEDGEAKKTATVIGLCGNQRIVMAVIGASRIRVRVPNSSNFRPKMQIEVRHDHSDVYVLAGRCPRFPGRW